MPFFIVIQAFSGLFQAVLFEKVFSNISKNVG
jgi:hypothetical protein